MCVEKTVFALRTCVRTCPSLGLGLFLAREVARNDTVIHDNIQAAAAISDRRGGYDRHAELADSVGYRPCTLQRIHVAFNAATASTVLHLYCCTTQIPF